jgi:hypothetical protein
MQFNDVKCVIFSTFMTFPKFQLTTLISTIPFIQIALYLVYILTSLIPQNNPWVNDKIR